MVDMNYIGIVVKILEKPIQKVINGKIVRTDFRVQLVHVRNIQIANLVFWGIIGQDVSHNYQPNDYIMVEGYVALTNKMNDKLMKRSMKKVQITVLKAYSV